MPSAPQLTVDSLPSYVADEGTVGLFNAQLLTQNPKVPVEFRFFEAIPEPSSVALGSLGLIALAAFGVRARLQRFRRVH
jgi:hypothetical protein